MCGFGSVLPGTFFREREQGLISETGTSHFSFPVPCVPLGNMGNPELRVAPSSGPTVGPYGSLRPVFREAVCDLSSHLDEYSFKPFLQKIGSRSQGYFAHSRPGVGVLVYRCVDKEDWDSRFEIQIRASSSELHRWVESGGGGQIRDPGFRIRGSVLQGYLAHKKRPPPKDLHRALGIDLP